MRVTVPCACAACGAVPFVRAAFCVQRGVGVLATKGDCVHAGYVVCTGVSIHKAVVCHSVPDLGRVWVRRGAFGGARRACSVGCASCASAARGNALCLTVHV